MYISLSPMMWLCIRIPFHYVNSILADKIVVDTRAMYFQVHVSRNKQIWILIFWILVRGTVSQLVLSQQMKITCEFLANLPKLHSRYFRQNTINIFLEPEGLGMTKLHCDERCKTVSSRSVLYSEFNLNTTTWAIISKNLIYTKMAQ